MALRREFKIPYAKIVTSVTDTFGTIIFEELVRILENEWLAIYFDMDNQNPNVMRFLDHGFIFIYDQASMRGSGVDDRLVAAHGRSAPTKHKRDSSRMRGFLGGGIEVPGKGKFDKGHVLAHGIGGGLDVNLFPQRPELNRGMSNAGREYRRMERYAADHPGTFVFSRMIYTDNSWVPSSLEYGVLLPDGELWVEWFEN